MPSENAAISEVVYTTLDGIQSWKAPDPLAFDYTHSETGHTVRIQGISRATERKAIYTRIRQLVPLADALRSICGYQPTPEDITDACWCAACVTQPKLSAEDWLIAGAEFSIGELLTECWIASRIIERRKADAVEAASTDGIEAAKTELDGDPS